ncbi:aromatic ring-hydroxylating oxygenase subunit alpha [Alicyclobacillus ferrooxydans]|uniref:2Fe-2S ferredoxin n=1 Tax=Alicyclobacillus ferrooxydans TaxID=471514 RepID=A0A0P9CFV0_9BACL|nr:aromatic ring-hydroxylating dioxygenase subunit alpha [Alicyclobacillus ferrooxydans]KPV44664.1 2Fe-2S ferredoxin [Alicyclobacillus ferrooxydans]
MDTKLKLPSDDTVVPVAWYPIGWSKDLKSKPMKRRIAGVDVVLFRDHRGNPKCLTAYCTHRGADLSLGACTDGHIRCAYHGWEFDGDGRCQKIPAHPERPIPKFAHLTAYKAAEKAGLIWVYPHDGEPPELKVPSQLEDPKFRLAPYEQEWTAHLTRVVESVLDVAHLAFVHRKTIGRRLPEKVSDLRFEVPDKDGIRIYNGGGLLDYWFPQQWLLRPSGDSKDSFINYVTFLPVDRDRTIIFGYAGRTFARNVPFLNRIFSKYSLRILTEDRAVVESQHPRPIPQALRMEAHVPADAPQVRFRQRWYEFLQHPEEQIEIQSNSGADLPL